MPKKSTQEIPQDTSKLDTSKLEQDEQAIDIKDFDFSRIVYSQPQQNEVPGGGGKYRRVNIRYVYPNGKIGPIYLQFGKRFCFGVQPDNVDSKGNVEKDKDGIPKKLGGYKVTIPMYSKKPAGEDPTDDEKFAIKFFGKLRKEFQRYSVENKKALGKGGKTDDLVKEMVGKMIFHRCLKDEEGNDTDELDPTYTPQMFLKLIYYVKSNDMKTVFYGNGDKEINPLDVKGYFHIIPTIKVDNLYINAKGISPQLKLHDATIEVKSQRQTKRFAPKNNNAEEGAGSGSASEAEPDALASESE